MNVYLSSSEDYETLLDQYDTWLFDCDGVLWRGDQVVDGVVQVLHILRKRGKKMIFVTNNATKSRKDYKKKFDQVGLEVHVDEIYGSAYAAAVYISSVIKLPKEKKVYVIGQAGLEEELRDEGVSFLGGTDPADNTLESFKLENFTLDPDVAAVVCGLDTRINYTKLSKAFQYLTRNPGCLFIATNVRTKSVAKPPFCPNKMQGVTTKEDITGPSASTIVPKFVTSSLGDLRSVEKAP
ncbi:hypothetical protein AGABI2DRAFT_187568 [Agaricus bisporus var. bisporus H97]|uniref:hypothetical protein n=1 Tax=Agaricus bisporus var. bisporus (strain H97 / ATCC MYA-4626 / FGSC 10389) TaxID=936046 RepID=UPI00029F7F16|nr:hypothetical protein AGABI2DRAFT_187568 [Agaricus bisporus var. bisporus H97]EKV43855.1 hypothetical protein AGABI2DRAFT_187568 [Agaricus bisporus var. bisporus H97]